jgi:hypothetical protein
MPRKMAEEPREVVRKFFRREFDVDVVAEYERLKDIARLDEKDLTDRHKLGRAINEAARNAHRANVVYQKARRERELFRVEWHRRKRELTRTAMARIEAWMDATGSKRKQITVAMVEEEICAAGDTRKEYESLLREQEELREIRNNLESLRDRWRDRQSALQSQARLLTSERELVLGGKR